MIRTRAPPISERLPIGLIRRSQPPRIAVTTPIQRHGRPDHRDMFGVRSGFLFVRFSCDCYEDGQELYELENVIKIALRQNYNEAHTRGSQ